MTWRKFHLLLLLTSTLLLPVVWGASLRNETGAYSQGLGIKTYLGTLELNANVQKEGSRSVYEGIAAKNSYYHASLAPSPWSRSFGMWHYKRTEKFIPYEMVRPPGPQGRVIWNHHTLLVPLWSVWLVFNGIAFAACRFLEKRTAAARERALAEKDARLAVVPEP